MHKFNKPCIDCGKLSRNTRCEQHTAQHNRAKQQRHDKDPARLERKKALYNPLYRKRAAWVRATATHCHICKQAFQPGDRIQADHLEAGNPNSELLPAHSRCNASRGNKPLTSSS